MSACECSTKAVTPTLKFVVLAPLAPLWRARHTREIFFIHSSRTQRRWNEHLWINTRAEYAIIKTPEGING